jgi:hypothetical protein
MTDVSSELPVLPDEMVSRLTQVAGPDSIIVDRAGINEFKDKYWFAGDETYAASAVVQPASADQVQEIVQIANEFAVPVWPHRSCSPSARTKISARPSTCCGSSGSPGTWRACRRSTRPCVPP